MTGDRRSAAFDRFHLDTNTVRCHSPSYHTCQNKKVVSITMVSYCLVKEFYLFEEFVVPATMLYSHASFRHFYCHTDGR